MGELVLENGKLTRVNHHKNTFFFSNNRITTEEENKLVRTAVNQAIQNKWSGSKIGGTKKDILLQEISNRLIGDDVMNIPLTPIEICGYIRQLEAKILSELKSVTSGEIDSLRFELMENEIKAKNMPKFSLVCEQKILQEKIKSEEVNVLSNNDSTSFTTPSIIKSYSDFYSNSQKLNEDPIKKDVYTKLVDRANEWAENEKNSSYKALTLADKIIKGNNDPDVLDKNKIQQFLEAAQEYKNNHQNTNFKQDITKLSNINTTKEDIQEIANELNDSMLLDFKNYMKLSSDDHQALALANEKIPFAEEMDEFLANEGKDINDFCSKFEQQNVKDKSYIPVIHNNLRSLKTKFLSYISCFL